MSQPEATNDLTARFGPSYRWRATATVIMAAILLGSGFSFALIPAWLMGRTNPRHAL